MLAISFEKVVQHLLKGRLLRQTALGEQHLKLPLGCLVHVAAQGDAPGLDLGAQAGLGAGWGACVWRCRASG